MERNHICKKCGGIAGWDSYYQSWICTRCGDVERKPTTNYDLLIRKTPEELAAWICKVQYREGDVCPPTHNCAVDKSCEKCWLDWLKEEAGTDAESV